MFFRDTDSVVTLPENPLSRFESVSHVSRNFYLGFRSSQVRRKTVRRILKWGLKNDLWTFVTSEEIHTNPREGDWLKGEMGLEIRCVYDQSRPHICRVVILFVHFGESLRGRVERFFLLGLQNGSSFIGPLRQSGSLSVGGPLSGRPYRGWWKFKRLRWKVLLKIIHEGFCPTYLSLSNLWIIDSCLSSNFTSFS